MSEEKTDKGRPPGASTQPGRTAPTQGGSSGSGARAAPPDPKGKSGGAPPARGGSAVAGTALVVALLVAAGAAGGGYWLWQQDRRLQAQQSQFLVAGSVQEDLQPLQKRLSALSSELEQLKQRSAAAPGEQALARLNKSVAELEHGRSQVQQELAKLQQANTELRQNAQQFKQRFDALAQVKCAAWAESEAGYLAFVAKNRIRFYGDVDSALAALKKADALLSDLGGESIEARRGIARAVDRLLKIQPPDRTKINQALQQIVERLPALPLAAGTGAESAASAPVSAAAGKGWQAQAGHAWEELKGSLSKLVVVARDLKVVPLVTPQERFFLQQNLTLELEAARLAALRGDQALYHKSLERVRKWLGLYFDEQSSEVKDTLRELGALADQPVAVELPDIGPLLAPVEQLGFRSAQ